MATVLGNRIKSLREETGMNQVDLATRLHISNTTWCQYETGKRIPSDEVKIIIARYFGVSVDYLLGMTDVRNANVKQKPPVNDEGQMAANTVRIAGRDGSYVEKQLSDDQVDLLLRMIDQMPDYKD